MAKIKQLGRKYHKGLAAIIIILLLSGVVILSHVTGILNFVEYKFYDFRINLFSSDKLLGIENPLRASNRRSDDIVLVILDQGSVDWAQAERGYGWPWPREAWAEFIDYMNLGGAKTVAFDILYSEPSVYRNARQDEIIEGAINDGNGPGCHYRQ